MAALTAAPRDSHRLKYSPMSTRDVIPAAMVAAVRPRPACQQSMVGDEKAAQAGKRLSKRTGHHQAGLAGI